MIRMLDTNACVQYLRGRSPALAHRIETTPANVICVCSIVKGELYFGADRSHDPSGNRAKADAFLARFASLPFDDAAASVYGAIRAALSAQGKPIGPNDLLIAAICLASDVTLVTNNVSEFGRVPGLRIENWQ